MEFLCVKHNKLQKLTVTNYTNLITNYTNASILLNDYSDICPTILKTIKIQTYLYSDRGDSLLIKCY